LGPFLFYSSIYSIMAKKLVITESQLKRMVQNEQLLKGLGQKIKSGVSTGLDQVKTGINKVATKVADLTQKPQPQQPAPQTKKPCSNPYLACIQPDQIPQLIKEWSAVNTDMSNLQGFGEAISPNDHLAQQMADLNAKSVIMDKLKVNRATFGVNEIKKTYCDLPDGTIQYFVVLEKN